MANRIAILISSFIIFILITWGFDVEGGRYLQQAALILAGFGFGNLLTFIVLEK